LTWKLGKIKERERGREKGGKETMGERDSKVCLDLEIRKNSTK